MTLSDYLFRGSLADLDPDVADLVNLEAERQVRRLILIPSESTIPYAVRETLTSAFHNIYAEGYPPEETRRMTEAQILDADMRLAEYRRYADPRYYKGTEIANLIEALARRRTAKLFATEKYGPDSLFVNVQPLSGAPANSAVYTALIQPGDTIMGMNLLHGGHLSHGSPAARSGKQYNAIFYGVNPDTERIDYDAALALALQHKPKIVIGGFSSYPWAANWERLRQIADACGAVLLADIAHVAGLVIAGVYPSPVGIADVVTFTTHKTLGGPRGAVVMTHRADLAKKLDRGVFPGEQGGPHMHAVAALAVALKLAKTETFKELQQQTVSNAMHLAAMLSKQGVRIVHGGTNSHMLTVDCKPFKGADGTALSGDMAARLLDLVGITCNRNTLPGDLSAANPSGIRLGTPWITQRGFREPQIEQLAEVIVHVLKNAKPFAYTGGDGKPDARAKLDFESLTFARREVSALCDRAGIDYELPVVGSRMPEHGRYHLSLGFLKEHPKAIEIRGTESAIFLRTALTSEVYDLQPGEVQHAQMLGADGAVIAECRLEMMGEGVYRLHFETDGATGAAWLNALSDGFVIHDPTDHYGKIPGPVAIRPVADAIMPAVTLPDAASTGVKDYFVGAHGPKLTAPTPEPLPRFMWTAPTDALLKRTPLFELHKSLGAKIVPFAGYEMPVWYTGVSQEHAAVRTGAGLFDVSHMGVWEVSGPGAQHFLNGITTNDVSALSVGQAHYSYFLDVDGVPLDDLYIYKLGVNRYMLVVNASNNDQDWAWVNAVREGKVMVDPARPGARLLPKPSLVTLRDLRDPAQGAERRVDIALQGPKSLDLLLGLPGSDSEKKKIKALTWSTVTQVTLAGFDLVISRTGYTGERIAYELFPHPDQATALCKTLIDAGATPCGLASRDSTRIEAGLPLYGHELGTERAFTPADAGFGGYVKLWKPFFVGKAGFLAREAKRDAVVTRFRMDNKGVRTPQPGTAVLDKRGRVVGVVTSCSIDTEGYQTGQAYLKQEFATEGTAILILTGGAKAAKSDLTLGDKVTIPDTATVLSRFPARKK